MSIHQDRAELRAAAVRVIEILESQSKAKHEKLARRDWLAPPALASFRDLEPIGFGITSSDWFIFDPKECTPAVVWPLQVGFVAERKNDPDCPLVFTNWRTVTMKEVRGYASRFSPHMLRMDLGQVQNGKLYTAAGLYAWIGGSWVDAANRTAWRNGEIPEKFDATLTESDRLQPGLATAIALRQRYEWAVSLSFENSPSVRFATDATGMKDVFRIRDIPEGKDRRVALMTWVADHWRQTRTDPELETYVRAHLRGAVSFTWQGMHVELLPARFDVEKRDALIDERQAMKNTGADRRQSLR